MQRKYKTFTATDNTTDYIYTATDKVELYKVIGTATLTTGDYIIATDASELGISEVIILWLADVTLSGNNVILLGKTLTAFEVTNANIFQFTYTGGVWTGYCLTGLTDPDFISPDILHATGGLTGGAGTAISIDASATIATNKAPVMYTDANGLGITIDDYHFRTDWNTRLSRGDNPKWIYLDTSSDFTTTPASTSTITMLTDLTTRIKAGMAVRYKIGGSYYYGIVTAISNILMTIAGAPMGGVIQELYFSPDPETVEVKQYLTGENYNHANDAAVLDVHANMKGGDIWIKGNAACVYFTAISKTNDGTASPLVNVSVGGSVICSSNTDKGLATTTTVAKTVVDIKTANYDVDFGDVIEVTVDLNGGTGDADYLLVNVVFVYK